MLQGVNELLRPTSVKLWNVKLNKFCAFYGLIVCLMFLYAERRDFRRHFKRSTPFIPVYYEAVGLPPSMYQFDNSKNISCNSPANH